MISSPDIYEDRLLAFVDILGFSRLISRSIQDRAIAQNLLDLFNRLNAVFVGFGSEDFAITLFSDSLCLSSRNPPSPIPFCCGLSVIVTSLLGLGYPIRGAISRGLLYHRQNTIFGPCMVRAYSIESRLAIFPRIVIDPSLQVEVTPEDAEFDPIYICEDGLRCINFLSPVLLHVSLRLLGLPEEDMTSDIINSIDRLCADASDDAALQKLHWLRTYAQRVMSAGPPPEQQIVRLVQQAADAAAAAAERTRS